MSAFCLSWKVIAHILQRTESPYLLIVFQLKILLLLGRKIPRVFIFFPHEKRFEMKNSLWCTYDEKELDLFRSSYFPVTISCECKLFEKWLNFLIARGYMLLSIIFMKSSFMIYFLSSIKVLFLTFMSAIHDFHPLFYRLAPTENISIFSPLFLALWRINYIDIKQEKI